MNGPLPAFLNANAALVQGGFAVLPSALLGKVWPELEIAAVTGDAESYRYLVESIRRFPKPNAFAEMIRAAGFARVKWQSLTGGIVALHSGWRL